MSDMFSQHSYWLWLIIGLLLAGLEIFVPGIFLIWFALAAIITGVIDLFFDFSWQGNFIVFCMASVISVFLGRFLDNLHKDGSASASLNDRTASMIGQNFLLTESIVNGIGRIKVDDSSWRVQSNQPILAGAHVRVTSVSTDGTTLIVEGI